MYLPREVPLEREREREREREVEMSSHNGGFWYSAIFFTTIGHIHLSTIFFDFDDDGAHSATMPEGYADEKLHTTVLATTMGIKGPLRNRYPLARYVDTTSIVITACLL